MKSTDHLDYVDFIKREYANRKNLNSAYSLRAYAKSLGLAVSGLSSILNKKSGLSEKMAQKIAVEIELDEVEREVFLNLVNSEHSRDKQKRVDAKDRLNTLKNKKKYEALSTNHYNLISEWYYFAIINVMDLTHFDGSAEFIAKQLNLDKLLVVKALEQLAQLSLVSNNYGLYKLEQNNLSTTQDIASSAIKNSHMQRLKMAMHSLQKDSVEQRDISSISMAIDIAKLPEAKKKIKEFRRELSAFLESGDRNAVYNLNIQLFPLRGVENEKN